ncbi:GNAT family N-acetyltransferase [Chitinibacter tainanensis]|uniref:GNAT family N-acetyltransferase n=1 Tax=Chitinibacter tainanensis TaxID=230667 RepID=UPI001B7FB6CE|nr:GNAT family N-acetyltransferase [Chitinibacter tainanensis]
MHQANPEDFESLVSLRIVAMRESLERIGRFDIHRARERFRSSFSACDTYHIKLNHEKIGFVAFKVLDNQLLLEHLYIHPDHQGEGVGSEVLNYVITESEKIRRPIHVGALRESDSNRFYVRHGFILHRQEEHDNYYIRPISTQTGNTNP